MDGRDVLGVILALLAYAVVSRRLERWWISMPMMLVALGAVGDATDAVELGVAIDDVALLAEVTLGVILFSDAVRMDVGGLRRAAGLPLRLLLVGLPITVALGAVVNWLLLPGLSFWAAALVAVVLAPTDAALGEAVVTDHSVPSRIRQALNVESGLNDGLAVPAFVLFAELATGELRGGGEWTDFVVRQLGGGALAGIVIGGVAAWALGASTRAGWIAGIWAQLATLAVALLTISVAIEISVNAFIAAFVAGAMFGSVLADDLATHLEEYTADSAALLAALAFFVFGNLFVLDAFESVSFRVVACSVLALTLGRMAPVAVATAFSGLRSRTVAFLGWFGPRGLASIVFGITLLEDDAEFGAELFDVITLTVLLSVVLHGVTAPPLAAAYGRWYAAHGPMVDTMAEAEPAGERRLGGRCGRR